MYKRYGLLLFIATLFFLFVSCSKPIENNIPEQTPVNGEQPDSSTTETLRPDEEVPSTALNQQDDSQTQENDAQMGKLPVEGVRPFAVMIDNEGTRSLPQGGLELAQVIYEIIVEGGETRLMPLFWDANPSMIGPVRSSRHYFLDYMMEHDAIYVHFGWSPMAEKDISVFKINNINGVANGGEIFWDLTKDRNNWQDSYTSMERIKEYTRKVKYRTETERKPVFRYNKTVEEIPGGHKAEKITLKYSSGYSCGYEYDPVSKTYKRFRKGVPQTERVSGMQLEVRNIIIQHVRNFTIKGDDAGRQEVNTVGTGNGWYVSCGKAIKIKWSKDSRTDSTKYTDETGNGIFLNPGQTWVQVLPVTGKAEFE